MTNIVCMQSNKQSKPKSAETNPHLIKRKASFTAAAHMFLGHVMLGRIHHAATCIPLACFGHPGKAAVHLAPAAKPLLAPSAAPVEPEQCIQSIAIQPRTLPCQSSHKQQVACLQWHITAGQGQSTLGVMPRLP